LKASRTASSRRGQEGFTLAALIVLLTIISIIVAYTVPDQWSLVMRRERERQTIFLMKQYARAILAWQQKHNNTVPVSLDQLEEARKPRMLRGTRRWPNPLTGSDKDWILVPPQALTQNAPPGTQPGIGGGGIPPQTPGLQPTGSKLNKELSPDDYLGPFVAVRPRARGKSLIALNEADDYSDWVYTVDDLRREIQLRQAALTVR